MGGTAYAAIPNSSTGVITGCYPTLLGNLRVIDAQAGQRCNLLEKQLIWNQAGDTRPKGDPGATGPAGESVHPDPQAFQDPRLTRAPRARRSARPSRSIRRYCRNTPSKCRVAIERQRRPKGCTRRLPER